MNLKNVIRSGGLTIGSWITIGDESVAEIMATAGFDWLAVDMEHSAITLSEAARLIRVIELAGSVPLVRVGENNPNLIKRVMDAGAYGVIVSTVSTAEEASRAVRAVKYPPVGTRGVGLTRAQGYGLGFERYKKWARDNSIVIVQIESVEGVENLEEILGVEGVDAFMVGPYDLSGSLGYPGEFERPGMKKALRKIITISKKLKVPAGFHVVKPDMGLLSKKVREGYSVLAFCFDALFLSSAAAESVSMIRKIRKGA